MNEKSEKSYFKQILKGDILALTFTIVMLLIFSVVLTYTSISESIIPQTIIIITAISILARKFYWNNKNENTRTF